MFRPFVRRAGLAGAAASLLALTALLVPHHRVLHAQSAGATARAAACPSCAEWNAPHSPLKLYGNVHYVGTNGLSALLLTSPEGHVLIDAGLPESAAPIAASIRQLGFRVEDIKLIVNSHAHYDHAGGIAELQRLSRATVAASASSARVLRLGDSEADDPQFGITLAYPRVATVKLFADGDTLRVGPIAIVAHLTPGHTPGGTSWSWQSCEQQRCLDFVYADSQTPISADGFFYTKSKTYPNAIRDFERGHAALEQLRCDVLITPHPAASSLWERVAARDKGNATALVDRTACARYAANARKQLAKRIETESAAR